MNNSKIVTKDDFGDLKQYEGLSALQWLAIVAEKAWEKEGFSHSSSSKNVSGQTRIPINKNKGLSKPKSAHPPRRVPPVLDPNPNPEPQPGPGRPMILNPTPEVQPGLPIIFKEKIADMGGSDPKLVIRRTLFGSDLNPSLGRLSMSLKQSKLRLTMEDIEKAKKKDEKGNVNGFDVQLIEPMPDEQGKLRVSVVKFKIWESLKAYVLSQPWNDVVDRNRLRINDTLQVWSFRVNPGNLLCFALVKLN